MLMLHKNKALEFISRGSEYIENMSEEYKVYQGIHLDIDFSTPVVIIPERLTHNKDHEIMVFNLGKMTAHTSLREFKKTVNYK